MNQDEAILALGALAQGTRLQILRLLIASGAEGLSAGNIAERLGVIPSSLSFHLQHLVQARLITQRRVGRLMIYAVEPGTMDALLGYLAETCHAA